MNANSVHSKKKQERHTMGLWRNVSSVPVTPRNGHSNPAERTAFWLAVLAASAVNAQSETKPAEAAASAAETTAPAPQAAAPEPQISASAPEKAASAVERSLVVLERVEIKGSLGRVKRSNTATRLDVETRDVPASVQVISTQTVQEQSKSQTVNDVLRNVSGVSQSYGTAAGNTPVVTLRGFDTGGVVLQDGYVRFGGNAVDWAGIEQLEVLKGPASVLYGQQYNIGGMINIISKRPQGVPLAEMEVSIGRWGYQRGSVDLGGPLNESRSITYRLNIATESSESFRDYVFEKRLFVAPAIKWDIGLNDSLVVSGDVLARKYRTDPGLPAPSTTAWQGREYAYPGLPRDRLGYALPINTYIGLANWDASRDSSGRLAIEWEHDINESWHLKFGTLLDQNHFTWRNSQFLWFQPTNDAGQPEGALVSQLLARANGTRFKGTQTNVDISGEFETKGMKHKLVAGVSAARTLTTADAGENQFFLAQETLSEDAWRSPGASYTLVPDPSITRYEGSSTQTQKGLYAQDMIEFSDRWKALIGYRYNIAMGGQELRINGVNDDTIPAGFTATSGTPRLGLVWQPTKTLSLYAGWSNSFNPNWGRLAGGGLAPPELGTQYEVGLKKDFAGGKAGLNVAAYDIRKTNVLRCAPGSADCKLYVLVGGQRSRGLELDLNGELLPGLRLSMAMTLQDVKVLQDLPPEQGGLPVGDKLTGSPRWIFNVFSTYQFKTGRFAGLTVGGGWNRAADSEGNLPNDTYRIAGTKRLDLITEYQLTPNTKMQMNINNVTDQINYATPSAGQLVFANKPREVVLTLTTRR